MESSNRKITFKVIIGYITLAFLAVIAGWLVLSEIKILTATQNDDLKDRNKVIRIGGLIADIYENESLARAALQLNSQEKFDVYISQNDTLLKNIDTLSVMVDNDYQRQLLDSVSVVFDKKYQTMNELRSIKANNTSEKAIEKTIEKLNSIDPILGKLSIKDYVENPETMTPKTKEILEEFIKLSNDLNAKDSLSIGNQKKIDSIVTSSRALLKKVLSESASQKETLQIKERELIENDLLTSRQLRNLLRTLELEMLSYSHTIDQKRKETLDHSINIITFAAIVSFLLVIVFTILILNDFWKSQRYRTQLEKSNEYTSSLLKSREQLIHMVSHDLRSPLSTISGYSELLQKSHHTNSKDDYYLKHIRSASGYMTQLVEELLEFSKLEGGNIKIEAIPFNLTSIVEEASENIQANHTEKPIELIVNQDKNMDRTILSDPFRIKQILYNLVGNAYKFTEKGSITVTSKLVRGQDKNFVVLTIEDTGIGIGKEKQQEIFKAFTQINNPKDNHQNGFGLGLAITKKLVDLLNGTLRLESEPGKGSTFYVSIPVKLSDKQIQTEPMPLEIPEFDLKAIVVDDDPSLRQLITDILKQHKIEVYGYEDAKVALSELDKLSFDLIITDIQLPKMNGFHFMETVKKMSTYQQQPIIAMTGRMDLDAEHFLESGFSSVIFKPFTADTLLNRFMELFPDAIQTSGKTDKKLIQNSNLFDTASISGFLDHDENALKSMLKRFLEDTKKTMAILKNAAETDDVHTINDLSHRMLTMFKQLSVDTVVTQLETLENIKAVKEEDIQLLESKMENFYKALEDYLTQVHIP
ncbi:MAG: ATP-binding protein [Aquaticitalea sp.]